MIDLMQPNIYGPTPPPRVYFQVLVEFNPAHPILEGEMSEENSIHESVPFDTFLSAMNAAEVAAKELRETYKCMLIQLDPEDVEDEYHFYLLDQEEDEIARVGVSIEDYRGERIH